MRTTRKLSKLVENLSEWSGPTSIVVEAFSKRLRTVEEHMNEVRIKIDLLEAKIPKPGSLPPSELTPVEQTPAPQVPKEERRPVTSHATTIITRPKGGEAITRAILGMLAAGPKTAREVQSGIGRSREHTARTLKRLVDEGLIVRSNTRPFRYWPRERDKTALPKK